MTGLAFEDKKDAEKPPRISGLTSQESKEKLFHVGLNVLPESRRPSLGLIFLRQFFSPLIYILLLAALVSLFLSDITDALAKSNQNQRKRNAMST